MNETNDKHSYNFIAISFYQRFIMLSQHFFLKHRRVGIWVLSSIGTNGKTLRFSIWIVWRSHHRRWHQSTTFVSPTSPVIQQNELFHQNTGSVDRCIQEQFCLTLIHYSNIYAPFLESSWECFGTGAASFVPGSLGFGKPGQIGCHWDTLICEAS